MAHSAQTQGRTTKVMARDLMTELTGVVPVVGGMSVTVGFGGDGAFCTYDPPYVNIPALPETEMLDLATVRSIRGFAAHEAAHLAFTDFTVPITDAQGHKDPLLHGIWNAIEDYMIERFWIEVYPGDVKNFAATEAWCCDKALESFRQAPHTLYDLRSVGGVALTWMRALAFGLGTNGSRACLDMLPDDHLARVKGWWTQHVRHVTTTQEALDAARIIHADILAQPLSRHTPPQARQAIAQQSTQQGQGQPGQGAPSQGQQGQQAPNGTGKGRGKGKANAPQGQGNAQGAPSQGNAQAVPGQGATGSPNGAGAQGQSTPQGAQQGQPPSANGQQAQGHTPGHNGQANGAPAPNTPGAAFGDPTQAPPGPAPTPMAVGFDLDAYLKEAKVPFSSMPLTAPVWSSKGKGPAGDQLGQPYGHRIALASVAHIGPAVAKTTNELQRALKTLAKDRVKTGRLDGKIDSSRMAFAAMGSQEIHKRKVQGLAVDTAVSILVDCSGSMARHRLPICQQMAVMLERALGGTDVVHEILGYTTASPGDVDPSIALAQQAHKRKGRNLTVQPVGMYVYRPFGSRQADALTSLGGMTDVPVGGTPTGAAILLAHDRLARRKERRHVLIVLTDGRSDDPTHTKAAVKAVESCGVTVLGIGIQSASVAKEFTHHASISQAQDLPGLMISTLTKVLLGEKTRKGMQTRQVAQHRAIA